MGNAESQNTNRVEDVRPEPVLTERRPTSVFGKIIKEKCWLCVNQDKFIKGNISVVNQLIIFDGLRGGGSIIIILSSLKGWGVGGVELIILRTLRKQSSVFSALRAPRKRCFILEMIRKRLFIQSRARCLDFFKLF